MEMEGEGGRESTKERKRKIDRRKERVSVNARVVITLDKIKWSKLPMVSVGSPLAIRYVQNSRSG